MGAAGKRVAVLIEGDFYENEIFYYQHRFVEEGIQLMEQSLRRVPYAKVVIMTGEGTLDTALACIRRGAEDYLIKPFSLKTF